MSTRTSGQPMSATAHSPMDPGLLSAVRDIWEGARTHAARTVNSAMVQANWLIGRKIVEAQQRGKDRAGYGEELLKNLSRVLRAEYGGGFSLTGMKYMRAFYLAYPNLIPTGHAVRDQSSSLLDSTEAPIGHALRDQLEVKSGWKPGVLHSSLSWIHYRALLKVDRQDARDFYEIEAIQNSWSGRALERQIDSLLFFRLAKSRDKKGLLALAKVGMQVERPVDVIRDHAVEAFEGGACHYLLKPLSRIKVAQALGRLRPSSDPLQEGWLRIPARRKGTTRLLRPNEVDALLADLGDCQAWTAEGPWPVDGSIAHWEERLGDRFLRVHRNALVRLEVIRELTDAGEVVLPSGRIPVSTRRMEDVRRALGL